MRKHNKIRSSEIKMILHSLVFLENEAKKMKLYELQGDILRVLNDASKKYGINLR